MTINILCDEIINQIAAGEVIENPSAAIKELVENSIDAKSSQIDVEIEESGIKKIVVKDNGIGISKEDLLKVPIRHATSKISNFNDLYNIKTMGFRGEALASIFSVSKTRVISRLQNSSDSFEISSYDTSIIQETASQAGTSIFIEDLFFNTPARRKYLKSANLELKSIMDIMNRFCIFYNNVKFTLKHNGKILINKPQFKSKETNLLYILGNELKNNVFYFENEINGIKVSGFFGKPSEVSYSFRKNQFIYVNERFVKSKLIKDAIYAGFGTNLMGGRHPMFALFLDIDPEIVDVNVHPTKIEIKFENELEVFEFVKYAIKKTFEEQESIKQFTENDVTKANNNSNNKSKNKDFRLDEKINSIIPIANKDTLHSITKSQKEPKNYFSKDTQKPLEINSNDLQLNDEIVITKPSQSASIHSKSSEKTKVREDISQQTQYKKTEIISKLPEQTPKPEENSEQEQEQEKEKQEITYGPLNDVLGEYRILGQINKTYIIVETKTQMLIIDQHAAEEKYFFETFKAQLQKGGIKVQMLLKPEIISLTNSEMLLYKNSLDLIKKVGIKSEEFGNNEILVRGVPLGVRGEIMSANILKDIIYEITVDNKFETLENNKIEKLASKACKSSIRAGYEMTIPEMHNLIEKLKKLKEPFNCPHGRPSILQYNFKELEKKFKRIV